MIKKYKNKKNIKKKFVKNLLTEILKMSSMKFLSIRMQKM